MIRDLPLPMQTEQAIAGHERRDADVKWIVCVAALLLVTTLAVLVVTWWMFWRFAAEQKRDEKQTGSQRVAPSVAQARPNFPEPRLQVAPNLDLATLRAREDAELNSYGWIDKKAGVVRI